MPTSLSTDKIFSTEIFESPVGPVFGNVWVAPPYMGRICLSGNRLAAALCCQVISNHGIDYVV